jgi:exopolyphosphatase/guanosine-5'-triphosphate,3'-diphosphate pyrophosphatase
VLDVGSNTVHLLVVDAHRGGRPTPMTSEKTELRLAERIHTSGRLTDDGADALVAAVRRAAQSATAAGCVEVLAFATSALRDATNCEAVKARVLADTGVGLHLLPGEDEARYTFLAARRWCGWSAGRLLVLDIGGGSLELAAGIDEEPDVAVSLPLGAGRLTRERLADDPPRRRDVTALREHVREVLGAAVPLLTSAPADRAVATSKTFRSLARLDGAAPYADGPRVPRSLSREGLERLVDLLAAMRAVDRSRLPGVSPSRAQQLLAGAVVAHEALEAFGLDSVDICPWALREGVILRRLDWLGGD